MSSQTNATGRSRAATVLAAALVLFGCSHDTLGPSVGLDALLEGKLELTPSELIIEDAAIGSFSVRLVRPDGSIRNLGSGATLDWTSSSPGIASVASTGVVSAKLPGVAQITVHMGDRSASAPVVVLPTPDDLRPMFDGVMTGQAGASLSDSVGVRVVDRGGLPVSGVKVNFSVEIGAGTVSPLSAYTDGAGVARAQWRLGDSAGDNALIARVSGVQDLIIRARGEGSDTDHRLEIMGGNGQEGTVDEPLPQSLSVRVIDYLGQPVPNAQVEWIVDDGTVSTPGGGAGAGQTQMIGPTDGSGISTISWTLSEESGDNQVRARLDTGAEQWFKASAKPGSAKNLSIVPSETSLGLNTRATLTPEATDRHGNPTTFKNVKWSSSDPSVATVDAAGGVLGVGVGQATITASSGNVSGSAAVTVSQVGPTAIYVEEGNGQSGSAGSTLPVQLAAQVHGPSGEPLSGITVTWTVVQGGGSVSAPSTATDGSGIARVSMTLGAQSGVNQVSASAGGLPPVTFTATASSGSAAGVSVTPATTSLEVGTQRSFQATAVDGSGNAVPGASFQWSSADPSVATIDANGQVTGVAVGNTTVTATSGSYSANATVNVIASAARVTLDSSTGTINAIGFQTRFTARAYEADGTEIPNANITWNSLTPGVASVDQLGRVVSQSVGTALIAVSVGCCQADTAVVDSRQVMAGVSLSPSSPDVPMGRSTQMQAMAVDSAGVLVEGVSVSWASSAPSVAPVSQAGVVSGMTLGTAIVTANVTPPASDPNPSMHVLTEPVTVIEDPGPPINFEAELPRAYVDTSEPTTTRDVRVPAGANLQTAVNNAQPGDRLLLTPGAVYGDVDFPKKTGSGWIVIQTDVSLPTGRMTPAKASSLNLAVIEGGEGNAPMMRFTGDVSNYRVQGVIIRAKSSVSDLGEAVTIRSQPNATTVIQPSNIILDRVYIHGNPPALQLKRCVQLSGQNVAVTNSSLLDCSKLNQDSQAIWILDGVGPTAIINNHLQAGSEVFMSGGGDPLVNGLVPSDMEIRGNYFHRPLSWKDGTIGVVKNLFELKNAQRVLLEGNVLEGNWSHGQSGWSILIKSTNQYGGCNWCTSDDVTIRWNLIDDVENGIQVVWGNSGGVANGATERIVVSNNVIARLGSNGNNPGWGSPLRLTQEVGDVAMHSNTFDNAGSNHFLLADGTGGPANNVTVTANVGWHGAYGVFLANGATYPAGSIQGNVLAGGSGTSCGVNQCPSSVQKQTVTIAGRSYSLPVVSGAGADLNQLTQRLQGVR